MRKRRDTPKLSRFKERNEKMSSSYGEKIRLTIFGQSHGEAIGMVLSGLPAGKRLDMDALKRFLRRRAPGRGDYATSRREADEPIFVSGLGDGVTDGKPLTVKILNTNTRSADYRDLKNVPRPGHADYTAAVKFGGYQDAAGGGHFSGRLTAPLCVAGGICRQLLAEAGIGVNGRIAAIAGIRDDSPFAASVAEKDFPVVDEEKGEAMKAAIAAAKEEEDSVGGSVACAVRGIASEDRDFDFDGLKSRLAAMLFAIPAVRSVDLREAEDGIDFEVVFKPTPSVAGEQRSVDLKEMKETTIRVGGRHDPCIVPRAVPCVEAAAALALYDFLRSSQRGGNE